MHLFIVGSGKLATAILNAVADTVHYKVTHWQTHHQNLEDKAILVHAGSGRQLNECIEFCSRTGSVLIELSTGLNTEKINPNFPLIICPNTSILLLKTLMMIKMFGKNFHEYAISITESHQAAKSTEPGTAYNFADSLKVAYNKITSVRDQHVQESELGIPTAYLGKHAYHKISIKNNNEELTIETKVLGHESYVNGVKAIINTCLNHTIENKKYTILDLVESGML